MKPNDNFPSENLGDSNFPRKREKIKPNKVMESDLSLIEVSGEDDSLLERITSEDIAGVSNSFSCSPLHTLRSKRSVSFSRIEGLKGNGDSERPNCSLPRDNSNKENINVNRSEVPKVSEEPQQLKRRKKGGGYNLRKSLAWNRAFLTEEGILNNLELSMISGTFSNSSREELPVIVEEGRKSLSGDSDCTGDSAELQALDGNLSKEVPASTLTKGKKMGGSLPKHNSATQHYGTLASKATRKVLSAHDVNRSGSKHSDCPRPVTSSSPANANISKAGMKDSKLPKIPVANPDFCSLSTTTKSAVHGARRSGCNQISQQASNLLKSDGTKGSSNNNKRAQHIAKGCLKGKSLPSKSSRRKLSNSPLERPSSSNEKLISVNESDSSLGVIPDPVQPAAVARESSGLDNPGKVVVSFSQKVHYMGGNMPCSQLQAPKASGLRMPSPSLGFFGQPKVSASPSLSQRSIQPCNIRESSNSNLRKAVVPRPPHAPQKTLKLVSDVITTRNSRVLSSSTECSVTSSAGSVSRENMKLKVDQLQSAEVTLLSGLKGSEQVNNQQGFHGNLDDVDKQVRELAQPYKVEKTPCKGDTEKQVDDNTSLLEGETHEQLEEDNSHPKVVPDVCIKGRYSSGDELEKSHCTSQFNSVEQVQDVTGTNDLFKKQHVEDRDFKFSVNNQGIISESYSGDFIRYSNQGPSMSSNKLLGSMHDVNEQPGKQSEQIKAFKYNAKNFTDLKPKLQEGCSESGQEISCISSQLKYSDQGNDGTAGSHHLTEKLNLGYVQLQFSDGNLSVEGSNSNPGSLSVKPDSLVVVDDVTKQSGDNLELGNPCTFEDFQEEHVPESVEFVVSKQNDSPVLPVMEDGGVDTDKIPEQPSIMDAPPLSVETNSLNENPTYFTDTQLRHDNEFSGQATSIKDLFLKLREHTTGPASTGYCKAFCSQSEESELPAQGIRRFSSGSTLEGIEIVGLNSIILPGEAEKITFFDDPHEENQRLKRNNCIVVGERKSVDEFQRDNSRKHADVSVKGRGSNVSEFEGSHGSLELSKHTKQAHEGVSSVDNLIEKSHMGDAKIQCLDDNLLTEGCNWNHTSEMHNQYTGVVDDINKQSGGHPELQNPCYVAEQVSQDGHGLHLNDHLLHAKKTCAEELHDKNGHESILCVPEQSDACRDELKSSYDPTQVPPTVQDDGSDVGKMEKQPHVKDSTSHFVEMKRMVENCKCSNDTQFTHDIELRGLATSSEIHSPLKMGKDLIESVVATCNMKALNECCHFSEESGLSRKSVQCLSNGSDQGVGINGLKNKTPPEDAETMISQNSLSPNVEQQRELGNVISSEDKHATILEKNSGNDYKEDSLVIKPPQDAVPFSDKWLAALEAAGEEILTLKTGAVQNSPPEKPVPEPGPWSPVRRKNNQAIGPFDCTKFTNIPPSDYH